MDNNNNKSASPTAEREEEKQAAAISLLKALEDMLHNKIKQKKEVHKTKNISENDKLSIEIDTLHWVLSESFY